jgi:hypothetical protein
LICIQKETYIATLSFIDTPPIAVMAPHNGSAKGRKAAVPKQQPKPVVPALPLKRKPAPAPATVKDKMVTIPGAQSNKTIPKPAQDKNEVNGAVQEPVAGTVAAPSAHGPQHKVEALQAPENTSNGDAATNKQVTEGKWNTLSMTGTCSLCPWAVWQLTLGMVPLCRSSRCDNLHHR